MNHSLGIAMQARLTARGVWRGIIAIAPIAIFVVPFGMAYGVAATESGLTLPQTVLMSAFVFSGAAQFASLEFWNADSIAFGSLTLVVLALNARHIVIGAAISPWVNQLPIGKRVLALSFLSDVNFTDSQARFKSGETDVGILLGGGLILWSTWVVGTALGAIGGALIGAPEALGIDVVMVCFFAAAVVNKFEDRSLIIPVLVASAVSVITLDIMPTGWNVIVGALAAASLEVLRNAN
ncbi:MAG: AzlC family ABC transporter permease [Pseudomonadota bacterium]